VDDVGVARRPAQRPAHGREHGRGKPGLAAEARHDSRRSAKAAVVLRPDNGDLDAALAQAPDLVGDESSGEVLLVARIGGREDGDLQLAEIL
jgi:hypothetical protein